ncbi:hypothetical protein GUITHDRAFT_135269 [Guillardia theta CCMP2712]|uniref:Uncharacterized protein n=1 Tax=Guillardia theta (strain CCMP2712) TaxID=905079 RepID=L1JRD5_GUITC|nr:hypothetical protein GUITHDRAFT_135269 [Guillardia theta CCMP2712]EKX50653.1 hypothetical protein GUITHDRAFT_135269 [Guillardia theta CCMP2712]|eukprot:XP_005837633.1 hypothetical protein GUITHDRAFT_135269 [Guillardia theta CCMP2712]
MHLRSRSQANSTQDCERHAAVSFRETADELATEQAMDDDIPSFDISTSVLVPFIAILGSSALALRGFWSVLSSPGCTVGDDLSSHFAEISFFAQSIRHGRLDFWFDQVQLGYPLFMTYSPLPLLLLAPVLLLAGGDVDRELFVFRFILLILWVLAPMAWYRGARGLGLDRLQASACSLLWMRVSDQHSFGVGVNALLGKGLLSHFMACLLLPLWVGSFSSRLAVLMRQEEEEERRRRRRGWRWQQALKGSLSLVGGGRSQEDLASALCFTFILMSNTFSAIFALMAGGVLCLAHSRRVQQLLESSWLLARIVLLAAVCNLFWMMRFLLHVGDQGGLPFKHWPNFKGDKPSAVCRFLLSGDAFDHPGYPLCTLAALVGFACASSVGGEKGCAEDKPAGGGARSEERRSEEGRSEEGKSEERRSEERSGKERSREDVQEWLQRRVSELRATPLEPFDLSRFMRAPTHACRSLKLLLLLSAVMLHGRSNLRAIYSLLPFHDDVESMRYILGVHTAGIFLGGIAAASPIKFLWEKMKERSRSSFVRLCCFFTLLFDINSLGYRDIVEHLREDKRRGAGHRYMVHQSTRSHFTLNMLAHVAGAAGLISYSRGYHDTLSFWHLEHFSWTPALFRLYNVKHVVVAKKKVLQVPSYISTVFPSCAANVSMDGCISQLGNGYSLHQVSGEFGLVEIVSSPLVVCSRGGYKSPALRYLLLNITRGMYEQGMLPSLSRGSCSGAGGAGGAGRGKDTLEGAGERDVLEVLESNSEYVKRKGLEGPVALQQAIEKFAAYNLRLVGMETIKAGLEQVSKLVQVAVESRWGAGMEGSGRSRCEVVREEERDPGRVAARVKCHGGFRPAGSDVVVLKMSFHSLWTVVARWREEGRGKEKRVEHFAVSPNLIGVSMLDFKEGFEDGQEVELLFAFRNPRDQHILFVFSVVLLLYMMYRMLRDASYKSCKELKMTLLSKQPHRKFRLRKAE